MSKLDALLARLEGVRATGPDRWQAQCPAHEDKSPSLSIRDAGGDRTLLHCFGGCDPEDILTAIGMNWADLYPDPNECAYERALAAGHKRRQKMLADITARDYARNVLRIAAADLEAGKVHDVVDKATIALAAEIMGGQHHG
jgi:hypothetical protein